jgi:hypothetical protein
VSFGVNREFTDDQIFGIHRIREGQEALCSILIEFGVPMKLVRLSKMCLNETYSKFCICKH